jgi:hypothetical protein
VESSDGNYLYFAKGRGKRGLWRRRLVTPDEGIEEPVLESLQSWGWWDLGPRGVFFLERDAQDRKVHLKFLDTTSRQITNLNTLDYPVRLASPSIAVAPDGRSVLYMQEENVGSNIVLMENFR